MSTSMSGVAENFFRDQIMTVAEVADFLRVSRNTVYRLFNHGRIPGVFKLAPRGDWRLNKTALDAWILQQERDWFDDVRGG